MECFSKICTYPRILILWFLAVSISIIVALSTVTLRDNADTNFSVTEAVYQKEPPWVSNHRIPTDTLPLHYNVWLYPDLKSDLFRGRVDITLNITASRTFVVTHVKNLKIDVTKLLLEDGLNEIPVLEAFEETKNEFWVVRLEHEIPPGIYKLHLEFMGNLSRGIVGFYKTFYRDVNGQKR